MEGLFGANRASMARERKGQRIPSLVFCLALLVLSAFLAAMSSPGRAHAQELVLTDLVLNNYEGKIRVRFGVEATTPGMIAAVLDEGRALTLHGVAALRKKRRYLWNEELARTEFESALYKGQDGLYHVTVPEVNAPLSGKDLSDLLRQAWSRIRMDLGEWRQLTRGEAYGIDMEITLARSDQSSIINKAMSLFGGDVAPPVGYQLDFTY